MNWSILIQKWAKTFVRLITYCLMFSILNTYIFIWYIHLRISYPCSPIRESKTLAAKRHSKAIGVVSGCACQEVKGNIDRTKLHRFTVYCMCVPSDIVYKQKRMRFYIYMCVHLNMMWRICGIIEIFCVNGV